MICDCDTRGGHCHATLVVHADGAIECTGGADCGLGREAHLLVVDCAEIRPACRCVVVTGR